MSYYLNREWISKYLKIYVPAVAVFVVPKIFMEYFSIGGLNFTITQEPARLFASRWIHFVSMFVLFEIVGIYILVSGWFIRRRFLTLQKQLVVYGAEGFVLVAATALLIFDVVSGKSMAGSNMIGSGNMEQALNGYSIFLTQQTAFEMLNIMHVIFTTGSVIYTLSAISNYAVCGIFGKELQGDEADIEERRNAYYRTLYASTALLTVGVLQLAAWLGLPTDNIVEKEEFTKLVTAMTIYLSMLFTLIAVVSASLSAFAFNEGVRKYVADGPVQEKLQITLFDRTMLISVFLPAIAGYLIKVVPLLFA